MIFDIVEQDLNVYEKRTRQGSYVDTSSRDECMISEVKQRRSVIDLFNSSIKVQAIGISHHESRVTWSVGIRVTYSQSFVLSPREFLEFRSNTPRASR